MIGTGGKTVHHEVQQPRQADAHRAANPAQGEALAQEVGNLCTSLGSNEKVFGASAKLALAIFTQMMLFAMTSMAVFLLDSIIIPLCWIRYLPLLTGNAQTGAIRAYNSSMSRYRCDGCRGCASCG